MSVICYFYSDFLHLSLLFFFSVQMGFIDMNVSRTFVPTTSKYFFFKIVEQYAIIVLCTLIDLGKVGFILAHSDFCIQLL